MCVSASSARAPILAALIFLEQWGGEALVQKHLGYASAKVTRRYQRKRDRFRLNLTKPAGL